MSSNPGVLSKEVPATDAFVSAIREVANPSGGPVSLHEPTFRGHEWDYVKEAIDSTFVSSVGAFVDRFEAELATATGARFAVAAVNGTVALQMAIQLAGVTHGDEVIVTAATFIGTVNAISHAGGIPHFVDIERRSLGLDAEKVSARLAQIGERRDGALYNRETGRRIAAIVPVHVLGIPCDLDALYATAEEFGVPLVEDIAEALGSMYHGEGIAARTSYGALSFNGNKIITTGGGGAILTNDEAIARRAKRLTTTAKLPHRWAFDHDEIAYNFRLPNLNAAMGCAQLEQLDGFLAAKRRLAMRYRQALAQVPWARFVDEPAGVEANFWLNAALLEDGAPPLEALLQATHDAGILTRPLWTPIHLLPIYENAPRGDLSITEDVARRLIKLPSSSHLDRG